MSYANLLAQKIFDILSPVIGDMMAESALKVQSKKIGVSPEFLSPPHLTPFAREVEKALVVFVGSQKAQDISHTIEKIKA